MQQELTIRNHILSILSPICRLSGSFFGVRLMISGEKLLINLDVLPHAALSGKMFSGIAGAVPGIAFFSLASNLLKLPVNAFQGPLRNYVAASLSQ